MTNYIIGNIYIQDIINTAMQYLYAIIILLNFVL